MSDKKNVLLLCGGGGSEHEVSLVSVKHIKETLSSFQDINLFSIEIDKKGQWVDEQGKKFLLDAKGFLRSFEQDGDPGVKINLAIPCIHGYPGETGDIQSYFEMIGLPYLGCNSETSKMCFNKITTKMWATALGVANTPYMFITDQDSKTLAAVVQFQQDHGDVVIKASNQGSSVGCFLVEKGQDATGTIAEAFKFSPFVLVEKRMFPRELEVSAYELDGKIHISYPGEIICPSKFYSYEEKYSNVSKTTTQTRAENLTPEMVQTITDYSTKLFLGLKLRHLSRIDFFLDGDQIFLNEINTFPGLTPISMFPKMMEANGHTFKSFLAQHIKSL
jgi:D-alanine-D-alanine ligase